jgi:hypothetical protein
MTRSDADILGECLGESRMEESQALGSEANNRIPLATEVMSYLGGVLAVAGVAVLIGTFWDKLGVVGQLALTGMVAASCLVGGGLIGRIEDRAAHRIQEFLLALGVLATGAFIGIAAFHVADAIIHTPANGDVYVPGASEWAYLFGFLGIAVVGAAVYWRYRFVLQQLAVAVGVFFVPVLALQLVYGTITVPGWINAVVWIAIGLLWGAAGLRRLLAPGETTALVISCAGILVGLFMLSIYNPSLDWVNRPVWPLWSALCGALLLLSAGVVLKRIVITGFGAAGAMIFIPFILAEQFDGSIMVPVLILMMGVALIGIAVYVAVRKRSTSPVSPSEPSASEVQPVDPMAGPPVALKAPRTIPLVSEILGYIGGAFALGASIALITAYADNIGAWGQIAVCLLAAVAGLIGGFAIGRIDDRGARRLEQFLLLVGVAGVGATKGLAVYRIVTSGVLGAGGLFAPWTAGDWAWFLGTAAAAIVGGIVWWFCRTWVQQLAFGASLGAACITVLALPQTEGPYWVVGLVLVVIGVIWGAMGYAGLLTPANAAVALGALGVVAGFLAMAMMGYDSPHSWALWAGLATTVALTVLGLLTRRYVVVGICALGLWQFLPAILTDLFPDSIAGPIVVMVLGVVFIGSGVALAIRAQRKRTHGQAAA